MDYKKKLRTIEKLGKLYRLGTIQSHITAFEYETYMSQYTVFIDFVMSELCEESRRIIFNDYFEKNEVYWYLEYYQRSTYYKLKARAVDEFWNCLPL